MDSSRWVRCKRLRGQLFAFEHVVLPKACFDILIEVVEGVLAKCSADSMVSRHSVGLCATALYIVVLPCPIYS